ncbi:unnamed protein product [Rhizoctonia solani]|uniref:Uncharacterized protein n=1 Tax=Rhizoctonia solani TaxID=456999 RepID=A0A8H3D1S0_9AGAM|nr:unnamed protein product [Rhizoctonia solani]
MGLGLGAIFYVSLLLINAIAILNEERFLARIGWSSVGPQPGQQYNQYDRTGYGEGGSEVKSKLINLIGAVRTLLRIKWTVVGLLKRALLHVSALMKSNASASGTCGVEPGYCIKAKFFVVMLPKQYSLSVVSPIHLYIVFSIITTLRFAIKPTTILSNTHTYQHLNLILSKQQAGYLAIHNCLWEMTVHKYLVVYLVSCALPTVSSSGVKRSHFRDPAHGLDGSTPPWRSLYPRQTPIIVAPPSGFRTPQAPQPTGTTSLNYWWPYGPNGVNPTATTTLVSSYGATETEETDAVDDTSIELRSSIPIATPNLTTLWSSASTESATMGTKTEESSSDDVSSSRETETAEPTMSRNDAFSVAALLPLFIILGVLAAATLAGWVYGWCIRRSKRGEPTPGACDIGGKPYQGGGYENDTIGPLYSLGVSWVDASRIHSRHNLNSGGYYAIGGDYLERDPGTPSKDKSNIRGSRNWFRYTLSGRKCDGNSPSGEKGLSAPLAYSTSDRQLPANVPNAWGYECGSDLSPYSQSPKTLRIVNASPTPRSELCSSTTSTQPTPFLSAPRHASLRRKIANKVKDNDPTTTAPLTGAFSGFDHYEDGRAPHYAEDWAVFKGDPHKQSPGRRYRLTDTDSKTPIWSPNPELHRERMRRLRITGEATHGIIPVSDIPVNSSSAGDVIHPLPPAPAVLLSPPLQPHLFFTQTNSDNSECDDSSELVISKLDFTRSNPSGYRSRHSNELVFNENDSFGPRIALNPANRCVRKGKARAHRQMGSTETLPLSPELRGAAMTKLDEIVKSRWSIRNLAKDSQSPTLYGALGSPSGASPEGEPHQGSVGETLIVVPRTTRARVE